MAQLLEIMVYVAIMAGVVIASYKVGVKIGWRRREDAYHAACFTMPSAIEESKK